MGNLLRQYWLPALPSSEFPGPDSAPKRMRILGENLVMFRDSNGNVGCVVEACPHRGASLYFGRNEEGGLRCVYHGWKFDVSGACVDMPSEPTESNFKNKVKVRAYPCRDVNHMIWVYMGPRDEPPPMPHFPILTLPAENVEPPVFMMEEANWVQNLEGDTDTMHTEWIHARLNPEIPTPAPGQIPGMWGPHWKSAFEKPPSKIEAVPTEYGAVYAAKRKVSDGRYWHRINQFIFPIFTMVGGDARSIHLRAHLPIDDGHSILISQTASLTGPIPEQRRHSREFTDPFWAAGGYVERTSEPTTYFYTKANRHNDFFRDFEAEKSSMLSGIPFVWNLQDRAMTELMVGPNGEPMYDRTHEHLASTDAMCILVRRQLIKAAVALKERGELPSNVDSADANHVNHACGVWPADADWLKLTEDIRAGQAWQECVCGGYMLGVTGAELVPAPVEVLEAPQP
jgi:phenylpropionate dioxygenase-like ring-hydroxylating dioxygenase large terminal subunit